MEELRGADVSLILYPLSAFRAMSKSALTVHGTIRKEERQKNVISLMQTRTELYDYLNYHACEQKLDAVFLQSRKTLGAETIDRYDAYRMQRSVG